jgi:hypothetical protein
VAQLTFDTNNPDDVRLLNRLASSGFITRPDDGDLDLTEAIDSFLSSLGEDAIRLVWAFVQLTKKGPTTLKQIAAAMSVDESTAKSRKMGLGRSVQRVCREHPGFEDPIIKHDGKGGASTSYTMDPAVRDVVETWIEEHPLLVEPAPTTTAGDTTHV